jgi:hypothetical protein
MKQICTQKVSAILLAVLNKSILNLCLLLTALPAVLLAQSSSSSPSQTTSSELVFENPVLVSGMAGQDGAIYKFKNVTNGVDATIKIVGRSSGSVKLSSIDTSGVGWSKAFQPVLGIPGTTPKYQNWWMEFQLRFYVSNSNTYNKLQSLQVTAIDVDGDSQSLQEYLQMNRVSSDATSLLTSLTSLPAVSCLTSYIGEDLDDLIGYDKKIMGPVQTFDGIDTSATAVMSTFSYQNKDMIVFRFGGVTGAHSTTVGQRLNSLWFKSFNLAPPAQSVLPLRLLNFQGNVNESKANLQWTVAENETGYSFELEKSTDGTHFNTEALIFTTLKTGTENYSYKKSIEQTSFYRLKMINKDNSVSYSNIIKLSINDNAENSNLKVLQNPVRSSLQFSYNASSTENVTVSVYSGTGTKIFTKQLQSQKGNNTYMLNLDSKMIKGFYLLEIADGNKRSVSRFIKE